MDILRELDTYLASDPEVNEIGFMYGYEASNIVLTQHKLGISTKCLKVLFKYVSSKLREYLRNTSFISTVDKYYSFQELISLSRAALIVRADNPTALNIRKKLILSNKISLESEIQFLNLLFGLHPKSPSCWEHRRWCLQLLYPNKQYSPDTLKEELILCSKLADTYSRDYYAWTHRIWLLQYLTIAQMQAELEDLHDWFRRHISDYSAVSYHHVLLQKYVVNIKSTAEKHKKSEEEEENNAVVFSLLLEELSRNEFLLILYPYTENLWLQRRSLFTLLMPMLNYTEERLVCSSEGSALEQLQALSIVANNNDQSSDSPFKQIETVLVSLIPALREAAALPTSSSRLLDIQSLLNKEAQLICHVYNPTFEQQQINMICLYYLRHIPFVLSLDDKHSAACARTGLDILRRTQIAVLSALAIADVPRKHFWKNKLSHASNSI